MTQHQNIDNMCLYPRLIKNKKYTANQKNNGKAPICKDSRVQYVPIGCGNCITCRKQYANNWKIRLIEEIKTNKKGYFVTLTFNTKSLIELRKEIKHKIGYYLDNAICTLAVKRFRERYRKKNGVSIKHWLVTELGQNNTEHIHLHGVIWTHETMQTINKLWKYGYTYPSENESIKNNYLSAKTASYITKYVNKTDSKHKNYKSIILTSPGIGKNYIGSRQSKQNEYKEKNTKEYYRTETGHKIALPIYYRNKLYTEEQREKLWIDKIDKGEKYILGEKINIKENPEKYIKLLKEAQKNNKRLGYKDGQKDWNEIKYENELRQLKQQERIKKYINASGGVLTQDIG